MGVVVRGVELIFFFYCVSFHSVHFIMLRVFGVYTCTFYEIFFRGVGA